MGIVFNTSTFREPRFAFNAPPITYQDMEAPLNAALHLLANKEETDVEFKLIMVETFIRTALGALAKDGASFSARTRVSKAVQEEMSKPITPFPMGGHSEEYRAKHHRIVSASTQPDEIRFPDEDAPLKEHLDFNQALMEAKQAMSVDQGMPLPTDINTIEEARRALATAFQVPEEMLFPQPHPVDLEPEDRARLERLRCRYIPGWTESPKL
jgi:hypothetical protein